MHAVTMSEPGGPEVLRWSADVPEPEPEPGPEEVLVRVAATAVNRADILQRQGNYTPPPGASPLLGLECSGTVVAVGGRVTEWSAGDEACALLTGGGYAELVSAPAAQLLPVPAGVSLVEAAALPEVACTVWNNLVQVARLSAGEVVLIHGGASGIGTMALQVARLLDARPMCTAGSAGKLARCRELGADVAISYRDEDFVARVREETVGRGADVVLDHMGAQYLGRNVEVLAGDGRLVVIGLLGGRRGELDLGALLAKRASVTGTTLRGRPAGQKAAIVAAVRRDLWPAIAAGRVRPVVDRVLPLEHASEAHRIVEASEHVGKVVLKVQP